jgi:CRP-like cAMP-binding protein
MRQVVATVRQWLGASTGSSTESARDGLRNVTDGGQVATADGTPTTESALASADSPSREEVYIETGMTAEEYLVYGLELHDGRLRQQQICDWTGWSEPTVSRLLTGMEDDGSVVRYQIGREKIVCLPDETL